MEADVLKKLQEVETEILVIVDKFCRDNNLTYMLYSGTALGAVRHGGFIPWDDDIDICMERNEYDRFIRLWRSDPPVGYTLFADDEKGCRINHTKVVKNNTLLTSRAEINKNVPHGIWLDVFALDKVPNDKKKKKKLLRKAKLRLVYTRDYPYVNKDKNCKGLKKVKAKLLGLASRIMLTKTKAHKESIKRKCSEYVTQYRDLKDGYRFMGLASPFELTLSYDPDILETEQIMFEGHSASVSKHTDEMLTEQYGDYMQLPPESERVCTHNPEIICFDTTADSSCEPSKV